MDQGRAEGCQQSHINLANLCQAEGHKSLPMLADDRGEMGEHRQAVETGLVANA